MGEKPIEVLQAERDGLIEDLHAVHSGAPATTYEAYRKAQEALQKLEDMTFSDDEIDAFLPGELEKVNNRSEATLNSASATALGWKTSERSKEPRS